MGIDYSGKLLVGGNWEDVASVVYRYIEDNSNQDISERDALEDLGLTCASPWFDCDLEDDWVGFEFPDTPFTEGWHKAFEEAAAKWKGLTGTEAKLMGVQHIW